MFGQFGYRERFDNLATGNPRQEPAMSIEHVVTPSGQVMYDNFHFSEAVRSNGFLLCSGVIGTGAQGKLPEDIREEFRNAWSGIGRLLTACDIGYDSRLPARAAPLARARGRPAPAHFATVPGPRFFRGPR